MNLRLIKASDAYKKQICDMLDECYSADEKIILDVNRKVDYHDLDDYCASIEFTDASNG